MPGTGPSEEVDALAAECAKATAFLRPLGDDDWRRPTRCTPWRVREVLVHMTTMMRTVTETCSVPSLDEDAKKDRLSWWDYDIEQDKAEGAAWIAEASNSFPEGSILGEWEDSVDGAISAARSALEDGDPIVKPGELPIALSEYLATRVLEITIHTMDVRDAFGIPPDPSPEGMAVTHGILAGLLGADPRSYGFADADFAIVATGRRPLTDDERARLGDRAARFSLLA